MSVSLLLGLVYLISDSGLQKNLIGLQRMRSNGQAFQLNLDIFWLKDAVTRVKERPGFQSLEDNANLPDPDIIAAEIVEDLQAALAQFAEIASDLKQ
jgi:hypothetical protein